MIEPTGPAHRSAHDQLPAGRPTPAVVLSIGGSDSAGRCGIQADLATFAALGVHGCCALTVVTAQDSVAVRSAWPVPVEAVLDQIRAVLDDLPVAAVKTGMLGRSDLVSAIGQLAAAGRLPRLVVDTVLVDGAGRSLFGPEVLAAYLDELAPWAEVLTANRDELALLTGLAVEDAHQLGAAATTLSARLAGPAVVASGGRLARRTNPPQVVDVVARPGWATTQLSAPAAETVNIAGSGDSLSAAVAAGLAKGQTVDDAVFQASHFVHQAVWAARHWQLGTGRGPIDHRALMTAPGGQPVQTDPPMA